MPRRNVRLGNEVFVMNMQTPYRRSHFPVLASPFVFTFNPGPAKAGHYARERRSVNDTIQFAAVFRIWNGELFTTPSTTDETR
jgi:hypothetical protein